MSRNKDGGKGGREGPPVFTPQWGSPPGGSPEQEQAQPRKGPPLRPASLPGGGLPGGGLPGGGLPEPPAWHALPAPVAPYSLPASYTSPGLTEQSELLEQELQKQSELLEQELQDQKGLLEQELQKQSELLEQELQDQKGLLEQELQKQSELLKQGPQDQKGLLEQELQKEEPLEPPAPLEQPVPPVFPEAPEIPPATAETLKPRISGPPPSKLKRLRPRKHYETPKNEEPRQLFSVSSSGDISFNKNKVRRYSAMIIPAIIIGAAVLLIISGIASERKASTQTNVDYNEILASKGVTLSVMIRSPKQGETVSAATVEVAGEVRNTLERGISGAVVTISLNGTKSTSVTAEGGGMFKALLDLEAEGLNTIEVSAREGEMDGYGAVECFYQPEAAAQ